MKVLRILGILVSIFVFTAVQAQMSLQSPEEIIDRDYKYYIQLYSIQSDSQVDDGEDEAELRVTARVLNIQSQTLPSSVSVHRIGLTDFKMTKEDYISAKDNVESVDETRPAIEILKDPFYVPIKPEELLNLGKISFLVDIYDVDTLLDPKDHTVINQSVSFDLRDDLFGASGSPDEDSFEFTQTLQASNGAGNPQGSYSAKFRVWREYKSKPSQKLALAKDEKYSAPDEIQKTNERIEKLRHLIRAELVSRVKKEILSFDLSDDVLATLTHFASFAQATDEENESALKAAKLIDLRTLDSIAQVIFQGFPIQSVSSIASIEDADLKEVKNFFERNSEDKKVKEILGGERIFFVKFKEDSEVSHALGMAYSFSLAQIPIFMNYEVKRKSMIVRTSFSERSLKEATESVLQKELGSKRLVLISDRINKDPKDSRLMDGYRSAVIHEIQHLLQEYPGSNFYISRQTVANTVHRSVDLKSVEKAADDYFGSETYQKLLDLLVEVAIKNNLITKEQGPELRKRKDAEIVFRYDIGDDLLNSFSEAEFPAWKAQIQYIKSKGYTAEDYLKIVDDLDGGSVEKEAFNPKGFRMPRPLLRYAVETFFKMED